MSVVSNENKEMLWDLIIDICNDNSFKVNGEELTDYANQTTLFAVDGTYSVTVTDSNGCPETITDMILDEPDGLNVTTTPSDNNGFAISCNGGNDGEITVTTTGGTAPITYEWTTSNGASIGIQEENGSITGLTAGTYILNVTDAQGCQFLPAIEVILDEPDVLQFNVAEAPLTCQDNHISCFGANDGVINIEVIGGVEDYTYEWTTTDGNLTTEQESQSSLTDLSPGTYNLQVTDLNGCQIFNEFTIVEPDELVIEEPTIVDPACATYDGSIEISISGGCLNDNEDHINLLEKLTQKYL